MSADPFAGALPYGGPAPLGVEGLVEEPVIELVGEIVGRMGAA